MSPAVLKSAGVLTPATPRRRSPTPVIISGRYPVSSRLTLKLHPNVKSEVKSQGRAS